MEILLERPIPEVNFRVLIRPKQLTQLQYSAIITRYKGRQDQVDTPEFKQSILGQFLEKLMYQFNLEGDMGRHHLSISGAYTECGISTSTINRSAGKTFPPKVKLSEGRVGFRLYQIEEWLNGKRGGWN
jgi:predicted DNA-binding transcriptional regulator AlpA